MCLLEATFGIIASGGDQIGLRRLLFREIIRYDLEEKELTDRTIFDFNIDELSGVVLIPYDDYTINNRAPTPIYPSFDRLYEIKFMGIKWGDIEIISSCACDDTYVLGFGSVGDDNYDYKHLVGVSASDMKKLQELHDRLLAEGRISGGYALVGNCCT